MSSYRSVGILPMFAILLLGASFAKRSYGDEPVPKTEAEVIKKLQGKWKLVSTTVDGRLLGKENYGEYVTTYEGNVATVSVNDNRRGSFQITLRPAKEISEIDLKSLENPTRPANQGIYKFDGDTLTMCTNPRPVAARPKGFASVIGTGDILEVYEKIK